MKLILRNGQRIVTGNELETVDVLIEDGLIVEIGSGLDGAETIDLRGQLIMPGLIDVHVHLREPGFTHKETIKTGSLAAARGGFTTICAMPNVHPVPDTPEKFQKIEAIIEREACIKVYQYAPITQGLRSTELVDMKQIDAFAYTNDGVGVQDAGTMYQAMIAAEKLGKPIVAHTEDESILFGGVMHEGIRNKELGLPGILGAVESSQVARDVMLACESGCHYHVCHVSSKQTVEALRMGQILGAKVTAEVSPHHLLLNELDIPSGDAMYKMNPPLRSKEDQNALLQALKDGVITMIATDHAPHSQEEKMGGFLKSPFGITGSEIAFPLLYTYLVQEEKCTLADLQQWMQTKPREVFEIEGSQLQVGEVADIAVFDLESECLMKENDFLSKSNNTPFIGHTLKGMCTLTLKNGKIVWQA